MEIVIIIIAIIVYIIAGIIILSNDSASFLAKLFFAPVYIIIFVGMIIMGIADLIGDIKEKHRMKDPEYAEAKRKRHEQYLLEQRLKEKQEAEKEKIRKTQEQAALELKKKQEKEALEKKISFYENSEATKKIVEYIRTKSQGIPYRIEITNYRTYINRVERVTNIDFYFEGGRSTYDFATFQLKPLEMPEDVKTFPKSTSEEKISDYFFTKWKKKNNAYYLAVAINKHFNDLFVIKESFHGRYHSDPDYINDVVSEDETTITCKMGYINVELTREKRSF